MYVVLLSLQHYWLQSEINQQSAWDVVTKKGKARAGWDAGGDKDKGERPPEPPPGRPPRDVGNTSGN
jgi:hypothetical protein